MESINYYKIQLVKEKVNVEYDVELSRPGKVSEVSRKFIEPYNDREVFLVVCLNAKNRILGINIASIGSLTSTIADPSNVFKPAILSNSANIIIVHNHPSGDCTPSKEDKEVTERMVRCGELLGIKVVDSIILGDDDYYSMGSKGDMK